MAPSPPSVLPDLAALQRAVEDGTLELLYQPEVEMDSGAIVAMEGLVRWHSAEFGLLAPGDLLDAAERIGDLAGIGEWVLRTGAAEAARWKDLHGPRRQLWLNVSVGQLADPRFPALVGEIVAEHGLLPGALGLEVSERTVIELSAGAMAALSALRAAGVSLAIDDLTSVYAALGAIDALPVDAIKLGHRYVRGVGEPEHDDSAVAAVIRHAHNRGLYVVAEGVESWAESARLTELGCDRAHGFLFASAQRADKARWLLMQQGAGWRGSAVVPAPRL